MSVQTEVLQLSVLDRPQSNLYFQADPLRLEEGSEP